MSAARPPTRPAAGAPAGPAAGIAIRRASNKMQSVTAEFSAGADTWRSLPNNVG